MTTVIRAAGAADLLAMIPALVGFEPRNSVVLVAFRGNRTRGAMRFDLPASGFTRFATTTIGMFCKIGGVDGVVPVIRTDEPFEERSDLLGTLVRRLEQSGFRVLGALWHSSTGWGSYFDPEVPEGGHPLADIASSPVVSQIPADARPMELPERVPDADEASRGRMRDQLALLRQRLERWDESDPDSDPGADLSRLEDLPFFAEGALEWDDSAVDSHGALLLFAIQGPPVRDLVMLQWAYEQEFGDAMWSADTCMGVEARKRHADPHVEAAERMMGRGPRPDPERIERAIALLRTLVSRADDAERPAPLCMLAWLNWALGRASVAARHLEEALAIDPEYGMAELLDTMWSNGMLPEWAFIPPTQTSPTQTSPT